MENNLVLDIKNLHKKFTKDLRRSMIYGTKELISGFIGKPPNFSKLRKSEFWALERINIKLSKGQILGIVGANGSGKSTLLRLIAGIYPPDIGSISIQGRVAALISLGAGFHPQMSGLENIYLKGTMLGMTRKEIDKKYNDIVDFSELDDFIDSPVSNYSSGMRVRLGFSIATASDPDLILLDEVLAVGDRKFRAKCFRKIDNLSEDASAIFVTHNTELLFRICTDLLVLDQGRIQYSGNNISEGLEYYYSKYKLNELNIVGKAPIDLVEFSFLSNEDTGNNSEEDMEFDHNQDINISMLLKSTESENNQLVSVRLVFFNNNFLRITETNLKTISLPQDKNTLSLNVKFPQVEFSPGRYSISVEFIDPDTDKILIRYQAIKYFKMKGKLDARSPLYKEVDWEIK
jgi:lipopolysaccharide transport system ATP-binding protein